MHDLSFFESMPSYYRSALLVIGLVGFWILEGTVPALTVPYERVRHATLNLTLTVLQLLLALTFGATIVRASQMTTEHQFGIFYLWRMPVWLHAILTVLLVDCLAGYWIHRIEHQLPSLWRFHIVHHTDRHVDVTTGLRHHPVETIFRLSAQLSAVIVGGIPIGMLFLYQLISVFFAQWTHANVRIPNAIERPLSLIFVTPRMHRVHHHDQQPLTDTNYGNIFSIWDRLFGTFVRVDPTTIRYGIDSLRHTDDHNRLTRLLRLPFHRSTWSSQKAATTRRP